MSKPTTFAASISVGWGIGASMALVMQSSMLFSALGPADLPATNCPSVSAFHLQALITLPIALLHILLSIILFDAYPRKSWLLIGLAVFLHFVSAFAVRRPFRLRDEVFRLFITHSPCILFSRPSRSEASTVCLELALFGQSLPLVLF